MIHVGLQSFMVYTLYYHERERIGKYLGCFSVNVEFENGIWCLRPQNGVIFQLEIRGYTTDRGGTDGDCREMEEPR